MNKLETTRLLAIASGYDSRIIVEPLRVAAWMDGLDGIPYVDAADAVKDHYQHSTDVVMVANIRRIVAERKSMRWNPTQIEQDVMDCISRGILPGDWLATHGRFDRLSSTAELELRVARRKDREAEEARYILPSSPPKAINVGEVAATPADQGWASVAIPGNRK